MIDQSLFYLVNKVCRNYVFDALMPLVTELGRLNYLLVVAVALLFFRKKEIRIVGLLLLIGLLASSSVVFYLKTWVARPRPYLALSGVHLLKQESGFSFPSGHATFIFFTVSTVVAYFKRFYYLYIVAFLVAFSRVYIGVHYPFDIIAAAAIGTLLGYTMVWISKGGEYPFLRSQKSRLFSKIWWNQIRKKWN